MWMMSQEVHKSKLKWFQLDMHNSNMMVESDMKTDHMKMDHSIVQLYQSHLNIVVVLLYNMLLLYKDHIHNIFLLEHIEHTDTSTAAEDRNQMSGPCAEGTEQV